MLVPYDERYVEEYNKAMQSEELRAMTGSEGLSLEEEEAMQRRWASEPSMLCLLVLAEPEDFIGDVNAHFVPGSDFDSLLSRVEVDVMIFKPEARRHGHAARALNMLFQLLEEVHCTRLFVKIQASNLPSIGLFQKLGFLQTGGPDVFDEITLERNTSCRK